MKQSVMIAISGVKNSGKTTLIEKLIPELNKKEIKTAVIKHDGHDFEPDVPGTDSHRIRKAGACGTAVFSASKYLLVKNREEAGADTDGGNLQAEQDRMARELALAFPEADLILLEGFKNSSFPKLEIVRQGNSETSVCSEEKLLAVISDFRPEHPEGLPVLDLNDPKAVADFLEGFLEMQLHRQDEKKVSCKIMLSEEEYYFGPGVFHLLQKIQETGSIRSAAGEIGLSYTKACKMINRAEKGSGVHFLERSAGGRHGGKSILTEDGRRYLDCYQLLLRESQKAVQKLYQDIFRDAEVKTDRIDQMDE